MGGAYKSSCQITVPARDSPFVAAPCGVVILLRFFLQRTNYCAVEADMLLLTLLCRWPVGRQNTLRNRGHVPARLRGKA